MNYTLETVIRFPGGKQIHERKVIVNVGDTVRRDHGDRVVERYVVALTSYSVVTKSRLVSGVPYEWQGQKPHDFDHNFSPDDWIRFRDINEVGPGPYFIDTDGQTILNWTCASNPDRLGVFYGDFIRLSDGRVLRFTEEISRRCFASHPLNNPNIGKVNGHYCRLAPFRGFKTD